MTSLSYKSYADLQPGDCVFHAMWGPCHVISYSPAERVLLVKVVYVGEEIALSADSKSALCLADGRCVGKPSADWVPPDMSGLANKPTFELLPERTDTGAGAWPFAAVRDDLAFDAVMPQVHKLLPALSQRSLMRIRTPDRCRFNPQALDCIEPSVLGVVESAVLGIAGRIVLEEGKPTLHTLQPYTWEGYQNILQVQSVQVQPNKLEGVVCLLHCSGMALSAYLTRFCEHAPYLHADLWYEFLLGGIALDVKPARTEPVHLAKPGWVDELGEVNRSRPEAALPLNEAGGITLDVSQMMVLLPMEGYGAPVHEFQGRIRLARPKIWEPQFLEVYGRHGYILDVILQDGCDEYKELVVCMVVTEQHLASGWIPEKGQMVHGHCWLYAWLREQVPVSRIKPKEAARKIRINKSKFVK